ncbi:hypothetical protein QQ020_32155 [Fulvivirgaceae bacterium BMA12]|uniref:Lipoprotein n=1 Tax=Agaribacillus aureus TaxID=3051825 RepID=A0ABT8LKE6_9BACT|nr:hypothetical protein [Fulvivirgaceae bacterium BMA12]
MLSSCGDDPSVDCSMVNVSVGATSTISNCPDATGTVTVTASGGSGNFEYSLDGTNFQTDAVFMNVGGGDYTVVVRDGDGCSANTDVTVEATSDITFTSTSTAAGCGGDTGSITIMASGGDGNYEYSLDDGDFQAANQFNNVSNGLHAVTIRDGNNCETAGEGYVLSGISYAGEVATIISTYCAVSGCHVASEPRPDFAIFANVQTFAAEIKSRTQSRNMPRGSSLTDEQIAAIACWVDDGALDN